MVHLHRSTGPNRIKQTENIQYFVGRHFSESVSGDIMAKHGLHTYLHPLTVKQTTIGGVAKHDPGEPVPPEGNEHNVDS